MSIWSTLFALRDDDGLEATGLRDVFAGMEDLGTAAPGFELFLVRKPAGTGWESLMVRKPDHSGFESFQVKRNG